MALIIPGVEVKVVKEALTPQLAPSGVLGLLGITEKQPARGMGRAQSWNSFIEQFGAASAYSMPEAPQALANGVFELVVIPVVDEAATAAGATITAQEGKEPAFTLTARTAGTWANGLKIVIKGRKIPDVSSTSVPPATLHVFDLSIAKPNSNDWEMHRNLTLDPTNARYIEKVLSAQSQLVSVSDITPKAIPNDATLAEPALLQGGVDASISAYQKALEKLKDEADVDMVLAAVQDQSNNAALAELYSSIMSHCQLMASRSQGRIGFAQVSGNDENTIRNNAEILVNTLVSDRMILVAPGNIAGAVAGMVGSLTYYQSPTFKPLALGKVQPALGVETQQELLRNNVVPVVSYRGRGVIVVRGLTTDGDQVSVRRIADRAVRGVRVISELFIGRLNNEEGRGALKQNLIAFLLQMQKEGALVPSTDGLDPAFKVNVYSSQADFAQGIVRVDMAVRPVRAIDYIYATVLVQI